MPENNNIVFVDNAIPLADADIVTAASRLGVEPALIAAVAEVESAGSGFLPDKRPKILFERHVFARRTDHRFSATHPDISGMSSGGYGAAGAHQYERLGEALALDRPAALESASWGRFQVMGFNAAACGYPDVERFVAAMCESEAEHLHAFIGYCQANDLVRHLATHDWRKFTAGYNGTGNVDAYAPKLETAYRRHAAAMSGSSPPQTSGMPNAISPIEKIKAIQLVLGTDQDGAFGRRSRAALNALLQAAGQPGI
jgi:hypothetical protein